MADLSAARRTLGVAPDAGFDVIKATYRRLIAGAHPDVAGVEATGRAADLNDAFRALARAHRAGHLDAADAIRSTPAARGAGGTVAPPPRPEPRPAGPAADVRLIGDDTIVLGSLPGESFRRLTEAAHGLGEISYVDRSAAILEAVVRLEDGTPASLVISLQWRSHDSTCEAFVTLEALDRAESLDTGGVIGQLADLIPDERA